MKKLLIRLMWSARLSPVVYALTSRGGRRSRFASRMYAARREFDLRDFAYDGDELLCLGAGGLRDARRGYPALRALRRAVLSRV